MLLGLLFLDAKGKRGRLLHAGLTGPQACGNGAANEEPCSLLGASRALPLFPRYLVLMTLGTVDQMYAVTEDHFAAWSRVRVSSNRYVASKGRFLCERFTPHSGLLCPP
jgi:hypothetical protein